MTWIEELETVPPKLLRLFALKGPNNCQRLKTRKDIARDGGLTESSVSRITQLDSWKSMRFSTIASYVKGCGVDPLSLEQRRTYFERPDRKKAFFGRLNAAQRRMLKRILTKPNTPVSTASNVG